MERAAIVWAQGGKHRLTDKPCQDRACMLEESGVRTIALSDGAGNSRYTHSEYGAECVTETMARLLCRHFDKLYELKDLASLQKIIHQVCNEKLREIARKFELSSVEPLSCTMLAAAQKDDRLILCHLGDGAIGGINAQGPVVLSAPENGEFASTTYFMSMPEAWHHIRVQKMKCSEWKSVFMMSDGTYDYTFDEEKHCFTSGITAMAAMIGEPDGKEQLEKTITTYMTLADPRSDDCSFAGMMLVKEKSTTSDPSPRIKSRKQNASIEKNKKNSKKSSDKISQKSAPKASARTSPKPSSKAGSKTASQVSGKDSKKDASKKSGKVSAKRKFTKQKILRISVQTAEISTGLIFILSLVSAAINLIRW